MSLNWDTIIPQLKAKDSGTQALLYERYAPVLLAICRRYIKDDLQAEDIMIKSLFKILTKIDSYSGEGNFEGWMKRIAVNESLMYLRKTMPVMVDIEGDHKAPVTMPDVSIDFHGVLQVLDYLPDGYRTVFNLYVLEGYKHREIAEMLEISINTSKSQLLLAKKKVEQIIRERFPEFLSLHDL